MHTGKNTSEKKVKAEFRKILTPYPGWGIFRRALQRAILISPVTSTIVCDLLLKLKELSDVYNDEKAEKLLNEINTERKQAGNSTWEWKLIKAIRERTELLSDESYSMIEHIYNLRNFLAHPAMTEDYELISPTPEMTVAYIKKALGDIFIKPSVFAQNIVGRMSDDIAARKDQYQNDFDAFEQYLDKVYFQRMTPKMMTQVFRAFWKFTFIKVDGEVFQKNRFVNRRAMEAMLNKYYQELCTYIEQNQASFSIASNSNCLGNACILCAYFPQVYHKLDETAKYQIREFKEKDVEIIKWFISGDLDCHLSNLHIGHDVFHKNILNILEKICKKQGQPHLFVEFLILHYSQTNTYISARNRFDNIIEPYLSKFGREDFVRLIQVINDNDQIYGYYGQGFRNDRLLAVAKPVLAENFDLSQYEHFGYTEVAEDATEVENLGESALEEEDSIPENDPDLPF